MDAIEWVGSIFNLISVFAIKFLVSMSSYVWEPWKYLLWNVGVSNDLQFKRKTQYINGVCIKPIDFLAEIKLC